MIVAGINFNNNFMISYFDSIGNQIAQEQVLGTSILSKLSSQLRLPSCMSADLNLLTKYFDTQLEVEDHPLHLKYKKLKKQDIIITGIQLHFVNGSYTIQYAIDDNTFCGIPHMMNGTRIGNKVVELT